jgi:hypothetical protein
MIRRYDEVINSGMTRQSRTVDEIDVEETSEVDAN